MRILFWRWKMRQIKRMDHYKLVQLMNDLNRELARRRSAEHRALESDGPASDQ